PRHRTIRLHVVASSSHTLVAPLASHLPLARSVSIALSISVVSHRGSHGCSASVALGPLRISFRSSHTIKQPPARQPPADEELVCLPQLAHLCPHSARPKTFSSRSFRNPFPSLSAPTVVADRHGARLAVPFRPPAGFPAQRSASARGTLPTIRFSP